MEILVLIDRYLKGDLDYNQGVSLYKKAGDNAALKKMFSSGEDDYSIKKLKQELQKIADKLKAAAATTSFKSFTESKLKGKVKVEILPTHLRELYHKRISLIRETALLHNRLPLYANDAERKVAADRIIELVEERRSILIRCDYFMEHGQDHPSYIIIEKPEVVSTNVNYYEAQYKLKLLRSRKSKLKDNVARHADFVNVCEQIVNLEKIVADAKATI